MKAVDEVMTWRYSKILTGFLQARQISFDVFENKKTNLIYIQWFVVIATSYLVLFRREQVSQDALNYF